jgi:hypothetical protein
MPPGMYSNYTTAANNVQIEIRGSIEIQPVLLILPIITTLGVFDLKNGVSDHNQAFQLHGHLYTLYFFSL